MYFRWLAIIVMGCMLLGCAPLATTARQTTTSQTNVSALEQSITTQSLTVTPETVLLVPSAAVVDVPTRVATPTALSTQTETVGATVSSEPATTVGALLMATGTGSSLPAAPHPRPTVVPTSNTTQTPTSPQWASHDQITPTSAVNPRVYLFPVQPASHVSYGTCHHDYPATDIFTPVGSVFVAVTGGVIDFVSYTDTWEPQTDDPVVRGGLSVAIIGDDGIRYYGSHLSEIAVGIRPGIRVTAGQRLGLTGKTGDARFTPAHLHFGISRPTTPDDWRVRRGETSPYRYLNAWRLGINLMPVLTQTREGAC